MHQTCGKLPKFSPNRPGLELTKLSSGSGANVALYASTSVHKLSTSVFKTNNCSFFPTVFTVWEYLACRDLILWLANIINAVHNKHTGVLGCCCRWYHSIRAPDPSFSVCVSALSSFPPHPRQVSMDMANEKLEYCCKKQHWCDRASLFINPKMVEVWLTPWLWMSWKTGYQSLRKPEGACPYGGGKPYSQGILLMILHPPRRH